METLPSSTLREAKGHVMADWNMTDGSVVRLELEPIYCFNCGKPNGYIPTGLMSWVSWLCQKCSQTYGAEADKLACPDEQFWNDVAWEMYARWGRYLTHEELWALGHQGKLGQSLELLERESPFRI
jgi:hypothetical protein